MIENIKARIAIIVLVLATALAWVMPNFVSFKKEDWWFTKDKIIQGLDIQGGMHLVLQVDVNEVFRQKVARLADVLKKQLAEKNIHTAEVMVNPEHNTELLFKYELPEDASGIKDYLKEFYVNDLQVIDENEKQLRVRYLDTTVNRYRQEVVGQAIEVIRNRIDETGVKEPNIAAQGDSRILVQFPGKEDSTQAKELINRTARLEFKIVDDESEVVKELNALVLDAEKNGGYALGKTIDGKPMTYSDYVMRLNSDLKEKLPKGKQILFQKNENVKSMEFGKIPFLVNEIADFSGDQLDDAGVNDNNDYRMPQVSFRVGVDGRARFKEMTTENQHKKMAIVLDDVVISAPNINSPIYDSGVITLGGDNYGDVRKEAEFIATVLRAGALPAKLEQLEERTVGPLLGADAITKGKTAGIVGCILVLVFMLVYYKVLGVVASLALMMNLLLIIAIMTSLRATLTLPGVAGIVLTIGMAVDANVIIFERIKEELAKGAGLKSAIKDGFGQAFSAIFDANITTAAVCFVLMYYGTGPVKGFAVTLLTGIATSMFTAIFVSRTILDFFVQTFNIKRLAV